jgi:hypothetical protein
MHSWRIVATISKMIEIELSKATLIKLMHHLKSVPLLFPNLMETLHRINLYCKFSLALTFHFVYILEFLLVTIFPPHTTVEVDLSIQRCLLLLTQFRTSILTGKISLRFVSSIIFRFIITRYLFSHIEKPT